MRLRSAIAVLIAFTAAAVAQSTAPADPTLDTRGAPVFVKLIPRPAAEPWKPITARQRFDNFAATSFSPNVVLGSVFGAAMSQALNHPHEWGQGWDAYGARVGSSFGGVLAGNTVEFAASAALHEDNRYFRSNRTTFKGRLGYVLLSPLMSNTGPGQRRLSASAMLGGAASATVPMTWSPESWRGWDNAGLNFAIFYGQQAGRNFAREFMPSIVRYFRSRKQPAAGSTSSR